MSTWSPNDKYNPKHNWLSEEDKTLMSCWGLTDIHEIAECFMCSPYNIVTRARILGLIPSDCHMLSAKDLEEMTRLFSAGYSTEQVASIYHLPDEIYRYAIVPPGANNQSQRLMQDYYAKSNANQVDMFGNDEGME